jgi:hypothetical protein
MASNPSEEGGKNSALDHPPSPADRIQLRRDGIINLYHIMAPEPDMLNQRHGPFGQFIPNLDSTLV